MCFKQDQWAVTVEVVAVVAVMAETKVVTAIQLEEETWAVAAVEEDIKLSWTPSIGEHKLIFFSLKTSSSHKGRNSSFVI